MYFIHPFISTYRNCTTGTTFFEQRQNVAFNKTACDDHCARAPRESAYVAISQLAAIHIGLLVSCSASSLLYHAAHFYLFDMDIRAFRTTSEVVYSMWCNFLRTRGSGHVFHCDVHNKGRQLTIVGCTILIKMVQIFFASEIGSSIGSIILPSPSCICNEFLRILEIFI